MAILKPEPHYTPYASSRTSQLKTREQTPNLKVSEWTNPKPAARLPSFKSPSPGLRVERIARRPPRTTSLTPKPPMSVERIVHSSSYTHSVVSGSDSTSWATPLSVTYSTPHADAWLRYWTRGRDRAGPTRFPSFYL